MATLLDTLKKNLGQVAAPEAVADETGTVQQLLSARKGIVGPATALGPKGLSVAETAARGQAQQELADVGQTAQLQATQLGQAAQAQEQQQQSQAANVEFQRQQNKLQSRIQTEAILRNLEQNRAALTEDKRQAGMEQIAANLRLQTDSYINQLQQEGARSRLQDDLTFDLELKKQIAADNISLLQLKLNNQSLLDSNDREFQRQLAQINIDTAIQMAKQDAQFAAQQGQIQAAGQLATTAVGAYGKLSEKPGLTPAPTGNIPQGTNYSTASRTV
jgi:hypothetical protein